MEQQQLIRMFPDMEYEEMANVMRLTQNMTETQQQNFLFILQGKRRDTQQLLLFALLGFIGVAGIHRFLVGDIALGIIYFFTGGLCFIGTIVDLVNMKNIASRYNQKEAVKAAMLATTNYGG